MRTGETGEPTEERLEALAVETTPLPRRYREPVHEQYSGEAVLAEYAQPGEIPPSAARLVMIRFLAAQYFTNRLRGDWTEPLLRLQRSAALNAIGTGLVLDREQRVLRRALELDEPVGGFGGTVLSLLVSAAERARERGHAAGAVALGRIIYEAALGERLWAVAADAAERLSRLVPAERTAERRRWRRRARTLSGRAAAAVAPEPQ